MGLLHLAPVELIKPAIWPVDAGLVVDFDWFWDSVLSAWGLLENDGTIVQAFGRQPREGAVTGDVDKWIQTTVGSALSFPHNDVSEFIAVSDFSPTITSAITVMFYGSRNSTDADNANNHWISHWLGWGIVRRRTAAGGGPSSMRFSLEVNSTIFNLQDDNAAPLDELVVIIGRYDGETASLWVDGELRVEDTAPSGDITYVSNDDGMRICAAGGGTGFTAGVDIVAAAVADSAWPDEAIKQISEDPIGPYRMARRRYADVTGPPVEDFWTPAWRKPGRVVSAW